MKRVTAGILIKDGRILIARRKAGDRLAGKWEFPGGTVEDGETPETCLKREMQEEFDIEVTVGSYLGESVYHYEHNTITLLAYRTHWTGGEMHLKEHDDCAWISPDQFDDYDFSPADLPFVESLKKRSFKKQRGIPWVS